MDPSLDEEIHQLDATVAFRGDVPHRHHTWAKTFHSRPELYFRPRSTEGIQKIITLARRYRRRITLVGSGHSPSDLTCTSSWMINLDNYNQILSVNPKTHIVVMQSGIRLRDLGLEIKKHGLAMANLGSIDSQSIAGAIGTCTHGSTLRHGVLSESVLALKVMLANGRSVLCNKDQNADLFRAALVSLGALGVVIEVTYQAVPAFDIEWIQSLQPLDRVLESWETDLWTQAEFVRVWWLPYTRRAVVWKAEKTTKPRVEPKRSWYGGQIGYYTYHNLLYLGQWIPRLLPWVEWFVFGMEYGFRTGSSITAVQEGRTGLLMDCLYSQLVNEWAIPLEKGPEAITRMTAWLHGDKKTARIPVSSRGVYIHAPIEVRVTDTSSNSIRPFLDNTNRRGATLYLNATLYRPYNADPPCHKRYYEAFEYLMKELGGKPHWAKNHLTVTRDDLQSMYQDDLSQWSRIRNEADPEGMFVGDWHRRYVLPEDIGRLPLEEVTVNTTPDPQGGWMVEGELMRREKSRSVSEESFDLMHGAETEASTLLPAVEESE
jgi:D-arabinono-1,4-lactone oxidase